VTALLRITFIVANPDLAGGDRMIAEHASRLQQNGHKVQVVGVVTARHSLRSVARSFIREGKPPSALFDPQHFNSVGIDLKIVRRENSLEPDDLPDADLIIATYWETAVWIKNMPASKGKPVYFIQGYEPNFPGRGTANDVLATYQLPYFQIAVSEQLCTRIDQVSAKTIPSGSCRLVENAIDLDRFSMGDRPPPDAPTVGFIYSPADVKNASFACAVMHILAAERSDFQGIVFGAYPLGKGHALPETSTFMLKPSQDAIPDLYKRARVWIVTSKDEGFGLPLVEALACGTPVVSTDVGVARSVLDGTNGTVISGSAPSHTEFVRATSTILDQSHKAWMVSSRRARQSAERFTWARASAAFEAALFEAVKQQ